MALSPGLSLIDGPLAHIPSGLFAANCAAGTLAGGNHTAARGATLRRDLINVPARFAAPARKTFAPATPPRSSASSTGT
jgi:hypothetical protein